MGTVQIALTDGTRLPPFEAEDFTVESIGAFRSVVFWSEGRAISGIAVNPSLWQRLGASLSKSPGAAELARQSTYHFTPF
jgi:hypothetical protein